MGASWRVQGGGSEVCDCKPQGNYALRAQLSQGEAPGSHHRRRRERRLKEELYVEEYVRVMREL